MRILCVLFVCGMSVLAADYGPIRLAATTVDTAVAAQAGLQAEAGLYLVKYGDALTTARKNRLAQHAVLLDYLPDHCYLVRFSSPDSLGTFRQASSQDTPWIGPYLPHYKLRPSLANMLAEGASTESVLLNVGQTPGSQMQSGIKSPLDVVDQVRSARITFSRVRVMSRDLVQVCSELAASQDVTWIGTAAPARLWNDESVWVTQSGLSGNQATPVHDQGINGQGVIVAYMDTGADADSCYFADTLLGLPDGVPDSNRRKVLAYMDMGAQNNWDSQDHGTHVGGSIAGDSPPYGQHNDADGMAPGAKLIVQDGGYAPDDEADLPFLPADYINDMFQPTYDMGARIHSNSWGAHENFGTNEYTVQNQMCDQFIWDNPDFLIFFAGGNDGHNGAPSMTDPATAKNVVTVAATGPGASAHQLAGFSSNGPTADGRMKPDIAAPGQSIMSANNDGNINSNNCNAQSMSGTSMACPTAAGSTALIMQYYQDGFYPTGSAVSANGFTPSAALLKATLLLSGEPMSSEGPFPNNNQGWGRANLDTGLFFSGDAQSIELEDNTVGLVTGQQAVSTVTLNTGDTLKVCLTWSDFPSTPAAGINLVNDLDLEISGPGGVYKGNVFADDQSTTGGAFDRLNNVEMVLLNDAPAGEYTITVTAENIPEGPQPYALISRTQQGPIQVLEETGLSQTTNQQSFFTFDIPENALSLEVVTSGTNGDADLFIRHGEPPTTTVNDGGSESSDSNEAVLIAAPEAGTWHVLVHAFSSFTNLDLTASYLSSGPNCIAFLAYETWGEAAPDIRNFVSTLNCCCEP